MDGPSHYREAETLIEGTNAIMAELAANPEMDDPTTAASMFAVPLALAQVHATLALVRAVLALAGPNVRPEWDGVAR